VPKIGSSTSWLLAVVLIGCTLTTPKRCEAAGAATQEGNRFAVRIFNCDDACRVSVRGELVASTLFGEDSGWHEITWLLDESGGDLLFECINHTGAITYGFEAQVDGVVVWRQVCGQAGVVGCNDNETRPPGVAREFRLPLPKRGRGTAPPAGIRETVGGSLQEARIAANEIAAIGDVRTAMSAQAAYQSANEGWYDGRLECLQRPSSFGCIPGYAADAPFFLDEGLASLRTQSGYIRRFFSGKPIRRVGASPSSVASYAYVAIPEIAGLTGRRAFCGDSSGIICFGRDGQPPPRAIDGTCDLSTCTPFQ
jgi:hypothetical protein